MVPMDNHLKVLAEFNKPLREKVEKAIRETLVIENKQSISIAITKIVDILKDSR